MTIRKFALALFSGAAPAFSPNSSNDDQIRDLALSARAQLADACLDGRNHVIRAASRLLLECHTLLNRVDLQHVGDAPTPQEQENSRQEEYNEEAICTLFRNHPDVYETWSAIREEIVKKHKPVRFEEDDE